MTVTASPMWGLLVLTIIAVPIAAIAGLVMAIGTRGRLSMLESRFAGLEQRLAGLAGGVDLAPRPSEVPPETVIESLPEPAAPEEQEAPAELEATPPSESVPPSSAPRPAISLEERFGTQWVVWVGGIALVFGGFFLVRYSIEQGWFGPGMRVILGAVLAFVLITAGEWTRRTEIHTGVTGFPAAHIPSILTAAGTAIAYADVYAAYALYDFIGPAVVFLLLGAVALSTLAAALLHGPALAGLGLVGAFVTPLIVSSEQPNYWALYLYLAVVTAAAFALARARLWRWLAITAVVFGALWTLPPGAAYGIDILAPHIFHVVVGFVLVAALIVSGLLFGPDAAPGRVDAISSGALAVYLGCAAFLVLATRHDPAALAAFSLLVAATVAIAWRAESASAAVPAAAAFVALVFAQWAIKLDVSGFAYGAGQLPEPEGYLSGTHLAHGGAFAVLFGASGFLAQGRSERPLPPILWSASAVFVPIAILIALYYRIAEFDRSVPFAGASLLLAGLLALATEALIRRPSHPGTASASAIFATGAIASLALALTMALEKGWLTVSLALMVPGIAWVVEKRPLPTLR